MKSTNSREQWIASIATALFLGALLGVIVLRHNNKSLQDLLNNSRLESETLLSEKLLLDRDMDLSQKQLAAERARSQHLQAMLNKTNAQLAAKEREFQNNPKAKALEKELFDLRRVKADLENQIADLNADLKSIGNNTASLNDQIASLESKNQELKSLLAFTSNNFRIDATRGKKDRLTVIATKTKKLTMSFDLPGDLMDKVKFKIKNPDGSIADKEEDGISAVVIDDGSDLTASISPKTNDYNVIRRMEMTYKPFKKLEKGIYTIDIYDGNTYMISCQVKLR